MEDKPPVTLRDALRHQRFLVLAIVAAFLLGGGVLSLQAPTYESAAAIYLDTSRNVPGFDAGVAAGELLQHDFIVLSTSRPVLQQACATSGVICSAQELAAPETEMARRVSVSAFRGTSMLAVAARAPTPDQAAILANAVAQAMIDQNTAEVTRLYKPALDDVNKQLAALNASMEAEKQAAAKSPANSAAAAAHLSQFAALGNQYASASSRQQDILQQQARLSNLATLLQPAVPPARPVAPSPARYLLIALIAGLAVGVVAALLMERINGRIRTAEGLARAAGIPIALTAPRLNGHPRPGDYQPYSLALASVLAVPEPRAVLVMGASAKDHSDSVAVGLGAAAAHSGQRVVVVEADGEGADPSRLPAKVNGLRTVPAHSDNGTATAGAVAAVQQQYDFPAAADTLVLVAVPSPETSVSGILAGRTARRAVITATTGVTRFRDARRTAQVLQQSGIEIVVGILVAPRARRRVRP
jgi:capsular polysaccharide biosynthesis protein